MAPAAWVSTLVVGVAFCAFFYHFLLNQIQYSRDPDWSHAYLVPFISLYYIYENRQRILTLPTRVNWLGLPLIVVGVVTYFLFTFVATANHFVQGGALILTLLGVVLLLLGWRMWWALMFPMLYLVMGIRMPPSLLLKVTPTLQVWASKGAYSLLNILGFDTDIAGTVLTLYHNGKVLPLNVAEACSGMRMIVAFLALGIAIAFLTTKLWWQRIALIVLGVPVAILVNVLRVTTLGIASTVNPDMAKGEAHVYIGMLWLIPAFLLYLGIVWIIQHLFVESQTADEPKGEAAHARRSSPPAAAPSVSGGRRWVDSVLVVFFVVGAIGFAPAQHWLGVYLHKDPVPLRRRLNELPMSVDRWRVVGNDQIVSPEILREFGTDEYVTRDFALDGDPSNGILQLHVSYYTGGIDAVPHIPDRCYVGGGLTKSTTSTAVRLQIDESLWWPDPAYDPNDPLASREPYMMAQTSDQSRQVVRMPRTGADGFRLNTAEYWDPTDPDHTLAAGYMFIANGGVASSSSGVRLLAYDRSSRFAYYCKVQFTYQHPSRAIDRNELGQIASEFLGVLLPDLMSCLPDWWEVEHGLWPRREAEDDDGADGDPVGFSNPNDPAGMIGNTTQAHENG